MFFFFKQKTAYEMRISDWSSDVCSSDLYDNSTMPAVVFTDPQVASVGLTETAAQAKGLDVKVSLLPLDAVPRALAARDTRGLIKLVADKASDRLLGGQIMAPEGAEPIRSEEHTSELQQLMRISYAVSCLKQKK